MSSPTCCGCIELKTGCYILAILSLIDNIYYSVIFGGAAIVSIADVNNTYGDKDVHDSGILMAVIFGVLLTLAIIGLVFDCILISGLNGNKLGRIKTYLIFSWISQILKCINYILKIKTLEKYKATAVLLIILVILLEIYFLIAIQRMYNLMKKQTSMVIRTAPTESGQQFHNHGNGQIKCHYGLHHSNNDNNFNVQATTPINFVQNTYPNSFGQANHPNYRQTDQPPSYGQVKYNA